MAQCSSVNKAVVKARHSHKMSKFFLCVPPQKPSSSTRGTWNTVWRPMDSLCMLFISYFDIFYSLFICNTTAMRTSPCGPDMSTTVALERRIRFKCETCIQRSNDLWKMILFSRNQKLWISLLFVKNKYCFLVEHALIAATWVCCFEVILMTSLFAWEIMRACRSTRLLF